MKNILLTIQYDGTDFSGWQRQPEQRTVQGELERVLSVLCRQEITIAGTSRTDAGVHAFGQRATLRGEFGIPTDRIPKAANNLLSGEGPFAVGDIRIMDAVEMPDDFHARFDAVGKKYLYRIQNAREPDLMQRNQAYQIAPLLDLTSMTEATAYLAGEQDFRAFMASGGKEPATTIRNIYSANLREQLIDGGGRWITFEVIGNGFLYNMVRIMIGTLVDVGLGKIKSKAMLDIINDRKRCYAGHTAPPQGLYLTEVYYDSNQLPNDR